MSDVVQKHIDICPMCKIGHIFLANGLKLLTKSFRTDKITREETYRECRRDGPYDDTATGRDSSQVLNSAGRGSGR